MYTPVPPRSARRSAPPATYQDVLEAPAEMVAELAHGRLYLFPRPRGEHATAGLNIAYQTHGPFGLGIRGPGGWWIAPEVELHFGGKPEDPDECYVPDLSGWRRERLPGGVVGKYQTVAPDWVCEILSPTTANFDRTKKLPAYAVHGIRHAWTVDPAARTIEVFRLNDHGEWVVVGVAGGEERVRLEPFEDVEIDLYPAWTNQPRPGEPAASEGTP